MVEGWETQLGTDLNRAMFRPHGTLDLSYMIDHNQTSSKGAMFRARSRREPDLPPPTRLVDVLTMQAVHSVHG